MKRKNILIFFFNLLRFFCFCYGIGDFTDSNWRIDQLNLADHLLDSIPQSTSLQETKSLEDFYYSMNGDAWINNFNWLNGDPCLQKWHGIDCSNDGNIIGITFFRNRLNGLLPNSIRNLINLRYLTIINDSVNDEGDNNIVHLFNEAVCELTELRELNMNYLQMQGIFPSKINQLSNLIILNLAHNELTGSLTNTVDWSSLINLQIIELNDNELSGQLPSTFDSLISLEVLEIQNNQMSGPIPVFNSLNNLKYFDFRENSFSGTFPIGYFDLSKFLNLIYIGCIMNDELDIPEQCIRVPFCFKLAFSESGSGTGDEVTSLTTENMGYIDNSAFYEEEDRSPF